MAWYLRLGSGTKVNIKWGHLMQRFLIDGSFYVWEILRRILSAPKNTVMDLNNGMMLKIRLSYENKHRVGPPRTMLSH
jgi:hypothetical protein